VKLGQEESKRRRLHRGLNGHGTGGGFAESGGTGKGITDQSTDQVEEDDGELKAHTGVEDGLGHLGDGTGDEEAGGNDADDGGEGEDGLDDLGEELVEAHTNGDGGEDDLDGGLGNAGGIDGNDGTEEGLAQEGGHEDGTDGGGGRHEDGQSNVALGNVRAQVGGLTSVDGADEDQTSEEGGVNVEALAKAEGEEGHHYVAEKELHDDGDGLGGDVDEILGSEGDAHGKHESGKGGGEVLGREPIEGGGVLKGNSRAEDGPKGEEGGGDIGSLGVGIEDLLSEALLLSTCISGSLGHLHGGALAGPRREGRCDGHRRSGKLLHLNIACTTKYIDTNSPNHSHFDDRLVTPNVTTTNSQDRFAERRGGEREHKRNVVRKSERKQLCRIVY